MLTVRFPDGTTIQYNRAKHVRFEAGGNAWSLYTSKEGDWVATVAASSGCVIEAQEPCRIYNFFRTTEQLRLLLKELRNMRYHELQIAVDLKRELATFNSRTRLWRD